MAQSLYIVVFENGVVKVGAAEQPSANHRIDFHIKTGKGFSLKCVHHDQRTVEHSVYHWEFRLCARIGRISTLIQGKEWFKFDEVEGAIRYAKEKFHHDCTDPLVYNMPEPEPKVPVKWSTMARAKLHILRGKPVQEVCKKLHIQKRFVYQSAWYKEHQAAQPQRGEK